MRIVRTVPDPPPPPTRFGWPRLTCLPLEPEDVPDAEWESYFEEGLGDARGACVEIEEGFVLGLVRYAETRAPGIEVFAFVPADRLGEALDALLRATGLARADLPWVAPEVPPAPDV